MEYCLGINNEVVYVLVFGGIAGSSKVITLREREWIRDFSSEIFLEQSSFGKSLVSI